MKQKAKLILNDEEREVEYPYRIDLMFDIMEKLPEDFDDSLQNKLYGLISSYFNKQAKKAFNKMFIRHYAFMQSNNSHKIIVKLTEGF